MKFIPAGLQKLSIASVVFCSVLSVSQVKPASASNLVVNGSFEQTLLTGGTDINDGGWKTYDEILGWKATPGGKIEIQRGAAGTAQDGKQLTELDSHSYTNKDKIGIFQDIATEIGSKYRLSFFYSPRPNTEATENNFTVLFGNVLNQTISGGKGGTQTKWLEYTADIVANSNLSRLQFDYDVKNDSLDTYGSYIDNVRLEKIPEPGTLLGIALVGLALAYNRKFAA
ncbi:hemolysin-type calcium-binding region protein [Tolypothrix tenuis PCC 7101]|uniref:Hemolysin-type calcium-binding region protein n=1 Tax=Tolypothrix tenuis PCC 7101 TaxID=231146 RepID=A0A1Z4MUP0_9CYAN|nr:DUF642 domain-containing protein [Aulosira sp. FACHB-113]BAY97196.1 hemolysin-type calcium-binding region protein [Tolypothrix tenuis PCC 7101]BAZ72296.1 hemolysin-type calcium-binding region protein [Aulosira laxa NIES-50]